MSSAMTYKLKFIEATQYPLEHGQYIVGGMIRCMAFNSFNSGKEPRLPSKFNLSTWPNMVNPINRGIILNCTDSSTMEF